MNNYNILTDVVGEYATAEGLKAFKFSAGIVSSGDEVALRQLVDAGYAEIVEDAPKRSTKKAEAPATVEEITEPPAEEK